MLLGPTEDRVARYLADRTSHGRVTIRTVDLIAALNIERSEAYRITARLRVLGLFGIENDRGGTTGGRRYWRTPTEHDGARLDAARHRSAWSRILGWSRQRARISRQRLAEIRNHTSRIGSVGPPRPRPERPTDPAAGKPAGSVSFAQLMRSSGLAPGLRASWGIE